MSSVALFKHQHDAIFSKYKNTLVLGGGGSGKTFTGCHWTVVNAIEYPKALGFIGANTYSQLMNSTLSAMFKELNDLQIPFSFNQSRGILKFGGANILCKSMDNYDALRGIEIGYGWLDECAYTKREAYDVMIGRLRDKNGPLRMLLTTTPKGYNWLFDYFHPSGELKTENHYMISAKTMDNTFLPDGYVDAMRLQYDEKLFAQEVMGEFVNLTAGKAYYAFDRNRNVGEVSFDPRKVIYVGTDFNVDPVTSIAFHVINNEIHVFDEIFIRNGDTYQLCAELHRRKYSGKVIPDSTGNNRSTTGKSNVIIMKEAGFDVLHTFNPHVIDRVNNINRLLACGRIIISNKCSKLINDLEKVTWKGSDLDQTTDKLLTHLSDCLGYGAHKLFPIKLDLGEYKNHSQRR